MEVYSLTANERVIQVKAKIEEWGDMSNKDEAIQWLNDNERSLFEDEKSKMLEEKYWLEAIDSLHRYGLNLWSYLKAWKKSKSSENFFDWLDNGEGKGRDVKNCEWSKLERERVCYLQTPVEREGFEVIAKNGRLYYKTSGVRVETEGEEWMYVLSPCRELFVGKKESGSFHHSTFLAGAPVLAAGFIQVSDGEIKGINRRSGHYKPKEENFQRLKEFLEENQVKVI